MLFRPFNLIRWLPVVGLSCLFSTAASASTSAITHPYCDVLHLDIALEKIENCWLLKLKPVCSHPGSLENLKVLLLNMNYWVINF